MNSTLFVWILAAATAAGLLLLLLAAPALETEDATIDTVDPAALPVSQGRMYWEPASSTPASTQAAGVTFASYAATASGCTACPPSRALHPAVTPPTPVCVPSVSSLDCPQPVVPCAPAPCAGLPAQATSPAVCGTSCPLSRPGINHNIDPCVVSCGMIQLHSTLPQPSCSDVCFEWSASKGSFLDPYAPNPIYFAPATRLPGGEEVWIVLTITDKTGVQYTDQIKLHIMSR